jgi:hypothetical protein
MLSSQPPNTEPFIPDRDEPSPLENIVPIQEFPSRIQSVESPSDLLLTREQSYEPSSTIHPSPTNEIEVEPNNQSPEVEIRLPSAAPSNHEQEQSLYKTSSPSKNEHQQESSRQSPLLSYPARLEDLMRPTPSPFHSTHENKPQENEEQNQNDRLLPVSLPINETEIHNRYHHHHHPLHQHIPTTFEHNDIHLPPISPRRNESSNTNHTSIEGDDIDRQQLDTPPISPQNEIAISPDHDRHMDYNNNTDDTNDHHYHHTLKHSVLTPVEPTFITEHQRRPSSEKSNSTVHSNLKQEDDLSLYRNDVHLNSGAIKLSKHRFSPPSSPPPPIRPPLDEKELPTLTASQQHSKLSLRLKHQESKRKKPINKKRSPPSTLLSPLPQTDVGVQIITHRIDYFNYI